MQTAIISRRYQAVCFLTMLSCCLIDLACYYERYCSVPEERTTVSAGEIQFEIGDIDWLIRGSQNTDPKYAEWRSRLEPYYKAFAMDSTLTYYLIAIGFWQSDSIRDSISMHADSVALQVDHDETTLLTGLFPQTMVAGGFLGPSHRQINVQPIGIPVDYKGDFTVSFRLSFFDANTGQLVEAIPIELRAVREKELIHLFNLPAAQ
ncbi:MAG: hypothetical protein ABIE70_00625 [bacterium]